MDRYATKCVVGNVTGDALRGIADFIGETLADGNVLSGEAPQIPFVIKMFEQRLVAAQSPQRCTYGCASNASVVSHGSSSKMALYAGRL